MRGQVWWYVTTRLKGQRLLFLVIVGLLASAAGFVGGAFLGYQLDREFFLFESGDDPGLLGLLYGAILGSALLTPICVYLANKCRGGLLASLAVSAGIAAVAVTGLHWGTGFLFISAILCIALLTPICVYLANVLIAAHMRKR